MPLPIHALLRDEIVRGPLLLTELEGRKTRNGADFLDLKFKDATGQVAAKFWQTSADALAHISVPSPVWVHARVDEFQGRPQLVIEQIEAYTPTDEEFRALIPTSAWPAHLLWEEIRIHLRHEIQDEALWQLVEAVLEHPEVVEGVPTSPAATRNHHAYRAGLVEHMLSMLRLAAGVTRHYEQYTPSRSTAASSPLGFCSTISVKSGSSPATSTPSIRTKGASSATSLWPPAGLRRSRSPSVRPEVSSSNCST